MTTAPLPYIYAWDRQGRKGQPCEVPIRAKAMNSCLVQFSDGYTMVTSRNAIRKNKAGAVMPADNEVTPPDASAPTHQGQARLVAQRQPAGGMTSTSAFPQTEYPQGGRPADIEHEPHVHERAFVELPSDASIHGAPNDSTAPAPEHRTEGKN